MGTLLFWSVAPTALGMRSDVVLSGSMAPVVQPGDVLLSQPTSAARVPIGAMVLAHNPARPGTTLVHRAVDRNQDGSLATKGDANEMVDSTPVPSSMVIGLPRIRVPYVGLPVVWWSVRDVRMLVLAGAVIVALALAAGMNCGTSTVAPPGPTGTIRRHRRAWLAKGYTGTRRRHGRARPTSSDAGTPPMKSRRYARLAAAAMVFVALVVSGGMVWNASHSAFSGTTSNSGNSWASGSVTVDNDHGGSAVFSVTAVKPDASATTLAPPATGAFTASSATSGGSACIKVTYTGSLPANVRMYATLNNSGSDGGLGQFVLFDIDTGTSSNSGVDAACAGFTGSAYIYGSSSNSNVYLGGMPTAAGGYAGGLTGWNGATQNTSRWYRLSWLLPASVANAAQSESTTATFTWEAQNV